MMSGIESVLGHAGENRVRVSRLVKKSCLNRSLLFSDRESNITKISLFWKFNFPKSRMKM